MYLVQTGTVVATPAALAAFDEAGEDPLLYLHRHMLGDFGELNDFDKAQNELALRNGSRILSAYTLSNGERIWIITEADRASTCLLLPSDY